ncbi:hypothetical protein [Phenylobacterium sp.]|jgi:hypothetical protein|nr:hypothetical protein [Phenylobacterium sp.]
MTKLKLRTHDGWRRLRQAMRRRGHALARSLQRMGQSGGGFTFP